MLFWSTQDQRWVPFEAPCRDCGLVLPIVMCRQLCGACVQLTAEADAAMAAVRALASASAPRGLTNTRDGVR